MSAALIPVGMASVATGILTLRLGWKRGQGQWWAPAGWAALALGTIILAARDGAWGLAVAGLTGSGAAFLILSHSLLAGGAESKAGERATRTTLRLEQAGSGRLLPRISVFLLVTLGAFIASVAVGLAAQALGRKIGWAEADSVTAGLLIFPVAWVLLVTAMMMRTGPRAMLKPLGATLAVSAGLFFLTI